MKITFILSKTVTKQITIDDQVIKIPTLKKQLKLQGWSMKKK